MQVIRTMGRRTLGFAQMALSSPNMEDNFGLHMVVCKIMKSMSVGYGWFGINLEGGKLHVQSVEWGLAFNYKMHKNP